MNLKQQFLTRNDCYQSGRTIVPRGVMVHSIGVAQPRVEVFLESWNQPGYAACVHAFVSKDGVVQTLPWTKRGWHCYKGPNGSCNNTHISFEICEPAGHKYNGGTMVGYDVAKNADYFAKVYRNAVELTAMLCGKFHLDPLADGVVICHSEGYRRGLASNHADVEHWFPKHGKSMDDFRADVAQTMKGEEDMTEAETRKITAEVLGSTLPGAITTALAQTLPEAVAVAVTQSLEAHRKAHTYATLADVPAWGKETVEQLLADGTLKGNETGALNLSQDLLRALVIMSRGK